MKIGLLAYYAACNFGAFLQLLSTVEYIKKQGDEPIVISWIPKDFSKDYEKRSLLKVGDLYVRIRKQYYPMTELCETDKQVAKVIERERIEAVIIGSDAVIQHHPLRERIHFPCKRIIYIGHPTSDRMYPNSFWGVFDRYLDHPVPIAVMSGPSQDSMYYFIKGRTKSRMKQSILGLRYMSVCDDWTQKMVAYLTDGEMIPEVTPDPVFAFNHNASHLVPFKEEIIKEFNIPENYVLISFKEEKSVDQAWISGFQELANKNGLVCVKLPYADASVFGDIQYTAGDTISLLEWYVLIKYSKGYAGNNIHPVMTSIANGIPFYCSDNYGIPKINGQWTDGESSKIYRILNAADLLKYRVLISGQGYSPTSASTVMDAILSFDAVREKAFAVRYYQSYSNMMAQVLNQLRK